MERLNQQQINLLVDFIDEKIKNSPYQININSLTKTFDNNSINNFREKFFIDEKLNTKKISNSYIYWFEYMKLEFIHQLKIRISSEINVEITFRFAIKN
jgi:TFIIF-interacting CTD phosphatase-like protein